MVTHDKFGLGCTYKYALGVSKTSTYSCLALTRSASLEPFKFLVNGKADIVLCTKLREKVHADKVSSTRTKEKIVLKHQNV